MKKITQAVIPVAGVATRIQPLGRAVPKELLPLGRRPVIHYVVEELVQAGVRDFCFITGSRTSAIEDYFSYDPILDTELQRKGIPTGWEHGDQNLAGCHFYYVRQGSPKGISDALYHARSFVGEEPFFLHMGDSVITEDEDHTLRMIHAYERYHAAAVVLVHRMEPTEISKHGSPIPVSHADKDVFEVQEIIEKPMDKEIAAPYGLTGRYLIATKMVDRPNEVEPRLSRIGGLGSIFPPAEEIKGPIVAVKTKPTARLHDAGTMTGYLYAQVRFAMHDPECGEQLRALIRQETI